MKVNNNVSVNQKAQEVKDRNVMSTNDFLKIMAAEIQNQNPMGGESGGSKTDYLTQLAQFTTLEQMTEINEGISQLNMVNQMTLIGKSVKIFTDDSDIEGIVEKVKFYNGQTYLHIKGEDYSIGLLTEVSNLKDIQSESVAPTKGDE